MLMYQRHNRHNLTHTHKGVAPLLHHRTAKPVGHVGTLGRSLSLARIPRNARGCMRAPSRPLGQAFQIGHDPASNQPFLGQKQAGRGQGLGQSASYGAHFSGLDASALRITNPSPTCEARP
jgi:hypothetical protein